MHSAGLFCLPAYTTEGSRIKSTLEPLWPMRATVLSDAVFKQDRFERLRSFCDDLLFLLRAVQQDVVKVGVGSAFVLQKLIRKELGNGNLESVKFEKRGRRLDIVKRA